MNVFVCLMLVADLILNYRETHDNDEKSWSTFTLTLSTTMDHRRSHRRSFCPTFHYPIKRWIIANK
jgi:hypothetical protein